MLEHFKIYGAICRVCGCLFISNLRGNSLENAKVSWNTLYLIYSAFCFACSVGFQLAYTVRKVYLFSVASAFSESLLHLLHMAVTLKVVVNFISMVCGSSKLLAFFRKSAIFERTSGFSPSKPGFARQRPSLRGRKAVVFLAALNCYVVTGVFIFTTVQLGLPPHWKPIVLVFGVFTGVFFLLCDSLPYVVLRGTCDVLSYYIRAQVEAFQDCNKSRETSLGTDANTEAVRMIRLNMATIRELKETMNDVWQWALLATSGGIIFVMCAVLTGVFEEGLLSMDVVVGVSYATYASFNFWGLAIASQNMKSEVQVFCSSLSLYLSAYFFIHDLGE